MKGRADRVDPTWPAVSDKDHVVSEFAADRQGSMSPYGDVEFPLTADVLDYEHPVTEVNR